jgi:hypothetical protein
LTGNVVQTTDERWALQENAEMKASIDVNEHCLTVAEIAERLRLNPDTIRRLFSNEPSVIVFSAPRKGRRVYRTLRIPVTVYQRVVTRLTQVA